MNMKHEIFKIHGIIIFQRPYEGYCESQFTWDGLSSCIVIYDVPIAHPFQPPKSFK